MPERGLARDARDARGARSVGGPGACVSGVAAAVGLGADLVGLRGGAFIMGTDGTYGYADDGEGPAHEVDLAPFSVGRYTVTNTEFAAFVEATGHRTEAEAFGWSFVFAGLLSPDARPTRGVASAPWWRQVEGADWAHPEGPQSAIEDRAVIRWCTCRGTTRTRSARGPRRGCRPRPSGSTPRVGGGSDAATRGAMSSSPVASTA